jgi:signal transduction histidine kinase
MKRILSYVKISHGGARLGAVITLLLLLPPWFWLGNWYQASLVRQERADLNAQISARANSLVFAVNQRIALLQGLYAFTRTEWPGTGFDFSFEVFSSDLYFNSSGLRTLMIAPEGIARYVYPLYDSRTLSGYDVVNDPRPATRADIQRAIHTHEITLSQPGELPQGGFGVTAWRAVFRGTDLWGLVSISLDLPTILAETGLTDTTGSLELALRDGSGQCFFGPAEVWQGDPVIQKINLPEGGWELGGVPRGGWNAPIWPQAGLFRFGSLLLLGFLAGIVYLVMNRQEQMTQVAVLEERQRLARDLHDSLSQVLYSIGLGVKSALTALDRNPAQALSALEYVRRLAEGGQVEMRALIFELRPESLHTEGLVVALERQADILRTRYQINVQTDFCPEPSIPLGTKEVLFRVAQEATHNIVKHAHATQATLTLDCAENEIRLEIHDNGLGFDPAAEYPGHMGLQSMHERAAKHQGRIQIDSEPGKGTRIEFVVPAI